MAKRSVQQSSPVNGDTRPGLQIYQSEFGGLQGRAIASYFKMVWPECTSACSIQGDLGVFSPRKILLILDAKRSLLMQFSGPKSHMFCNSYQAEFQQLLLHVLPVRQQISRNLDLVHVVATYAWRHAPAAKTFIASYLLSQASRINEQSCSQAPAQLSASLAVYTANNGKLDVAWGTRLVIADSAYELSYAHLQQATRALSQ